MNVYVHATVRRRHGLLASIGLAYVWLFVAVVRFAVFTIECLLRLFILTGLFYAGLFHLTARLIAWSQHEESDG